MSCACGRPAVLPTNNDTKQGALKPTHCFEHWVELTYQERWGMKITKKWQKKLDTCAATRCLGEPVGTVDGACFDEDGRVQLCARHLDEATAEFKLWEIPGSVERADSAMPQTAPAAAPPDDLAGEMRLEKEAANSFLAELRDFSIQTQDELEFVAEVLAETKGRIKALETRRAEITKPISAALKSVRDLFAPPINALKSGESRLKELIADAKNREAKENAAAIEAAAEALDDGNNTAALQATEQVRHTSNVQTLQTREVWAFEITDADAVDRLLCSPDEKKIRQLIRDCAESGTDPAELQLSGLRFFKKTVVASKSR